MIYNITMTLEDFKRAAFRINKEIELHEDLSDIYNPMHEEEKHELYIIFLSILVDEFGDERIENELNDYLDE